MSRQDLQIKIRVPSQLKHDVELRAKKNNRSVNAELLSIISSAFEEKTDSKIDEILSILKSSALSS